MQLYNQLVWIAIAMVMVYTEKCKSDDEQVYSILFLHQWLQLVCFFGYPIAVYLRQARNQTYTIGYDILVFVLIFGIIVQNTTSIFKNQDGNNESPQTCIVSQYTNKKCGKQSDAFMEDPMYHLGLKSNGERYSCLYNIYVKILLAFCAYQLYNRMYMSSKKL